MIKRRNFLERQVTHINSIDFDAARLRIIEPAEELEQSAFAGAVRADDRDHLAGRDGQIEIPQRRPVVARIAECNLGESESPSAHDAGASIGAGGSITLGSSAKNSNRFPRKRVLA